MEISEAVKQTREAFGLGRQKFANKLGDTALNTIARWESGEFKPNPAALVALYNLANEVGRVDLARVFFAGSGFNGEVRQPDLPQRLAELYDDIAAINFRVMQVLANQYLQDADRKRLGEALQAGVQGEELLRQIRAGL